MTELYIIAIDFGTAYSGHAFSITARGAQIDPQVKRWGKEQGLDTPKTPTCILFNEYGEFLKFGYEARAAYTSMRGAEGKKHFYFENFKMALYDRELSSHVMIKAANGKTMKALKVFTEALRFLKDDALNTIAENTAGRKFIASDFIWVLTVPAIWDPSAKQFMREAATQAGIVTKETKDKLIIALEPEAASVWCKKLPADGFIKQKEDTVTLDQKPGTRYIVVDCGGGTIDITVHEVLDGGRLKELHKASGNDLGGQTVDRKFKEFLREIFCNGVWEEYETQYPSEAQKLMYEFTYYKQVDDEVQITCSYKLGMLAQNKKDIQEFFEMVSGALWDDGSITISKDRLRSFFDDSMKGVTECLTKILMKDLNIDYILLVGGFAESQIVRQHVNDQFGGECKVLYPYRPQEVILRGAIMYGREPGLVISRKCAFTYGFSALQRFDRFTHKEEKKVRTPVGELCSDLFVKLVEEGEDIECNETRKHILFPADQSSPAADFKFYRSESKNPVYVDDFGVEMVASLHVTLPYVAAGIDRKVKIEVKFGSTEIMATATDLATGLRGSTTIDFMTKGEYSS
ncbi:heat shock 70 kDa protein 12A-like [Pholidichthys leucotaenia]